MCRHVRICLKIGSRVGSSIPVMRGGMIMRSLLLALMLVPAGAFAQQWVEMADAPIFPSAVDASSIRKTYSYTEAWVRSNNTDKGETGSYLAQLQFKCDERTYATRAVVGYSGRNGTGKLTSQDYPPYQTFQPAIPGSIGASWLKFVCAYAAKEDWAVAAADAGGYRQLLERANARANSAPTSEEDELAAAERAAGIAPIAIPPAKVQVVAVTLGSARDDNSRIPVPRNRFWPLETIFASVITDTTGDKPVLGTLRAYWYYEEDGQLVYQEDVDAKFTGEGATAFSVTKPDGWPLGKYRFEVWLDQTLAKTVRYEVTP